MPDTLLTRDDLLIYCPSLANVPQATLDVYLDSASRTAEKICGREFLTSTVTERHPYPQYAKLWLRRPPVTAVASVKMFEATGPILMDASGNVTATTDERTDFTEVRTQAPIGYTIQGSQNAALMKIDSYMAWAWSPEIASMAFYEVTYTGGFAQTPGMIRMAIAKMVEDINSQFSGGFNIQSERIGDYAYSKFSKEESEDLKGLVGKMLSGFLWRAY